MIFGRSCWHTTCSAWRCAFARVVPRRSARDEEAPGDSGDWTRLRATPRYCGRAATGGLGCGRNTRSSRSVSYPPDMGALYIDGLTGARHELERFADLKRAAPLATAPPELSLWDPKRISAWRIELQKAAPAPLAVLRVPKIRLEVAVLPGTDDFTLNRAVGHIEDTAMPGTDGNSGIAGHRDGFFRGLKDVGLAMRSNSKRYTARRCITSNGCGWCTRKRCRCSTRHPRARSRWSPVTRSTTLARLPSATSSVP